MASPRAWSSSAAAALAVDASDSEEEPLRDRDPHLRAPFQRGRLGWWARGALLATASGAALLAVLGWDRARPSPTVARVAGVESKVAVPGACLCLFDVDRTLTGKQEMVDKCPGNSVQHGVFDNAFGGGDLTLSELAQGLKGTFCGGCYRGIVSAGLVGGPQEKAVIDRIVFDDPPTDTPPFWSAPGLILSQLVKGCPNGEKAECAEKIVHWFAKKKGVEIAPSDVYFFDDYTGNTEGFAAKGFNARQVSCKSREGALGKCGAQLWEIVPAKGVKTCEEVLRQE